MKLLFIVCTLVFLSACSKTIDIPKEEYGVLLRLGEIQSSVSGPATLEKAFLIESVRFIEKKKKFELGNGKYIIEYEILDPEEYYKLMGNRSMEEILEKRIAKQALNGKAINSKYDLFEIIDSIKLPIKLEKNS
ncbi:MAG TPA: hypothetical protein PKZ37_16815 [Gallionellaceae bacterium]|nr:hypothetical protein [Gallionellaceae bacterium]